MVSTALSLVALLALAAAAANAQEGVVQPGDNLIVEGVPPIPVSLAESVRRYTEFRTAGFLDWNPRRREMLIATRFAATAQIHQVSMPGGARRQLTFFSEGVSSAAYDPRDGRSFVYSRDEGGNEQYQIYRYDLATGESTLLTDGKSRNESPVLSLASGRVLYTSTRRNGSDTDLYMVDPRDPKSDREVARLQGGGWDPLDWSADDARALLRNYVSVNESYLFEADLATGKLTPLTPRREGAEPVFYGQAVYSRDGRGVYLTTDAGSEFRRLVYRDLVSGRETVLTSAIPWDVEQFDLSRDGRKIALTTNEAGVSVLRVLDTRSRRLALVPNVPVGVISGVKWTADAREIGFSLNSSRSPTDAYSVNPSSGRLTRWTESETGGLDTSSLATAELVRWKSFDGREISGFLYRPPARFSGKRPVIVNIHGGPESQFRPQFLGRINYYLNELGVAVLFPNVRGSTGFGKTFVKLDNGMLRENSYKDVGALFDWIAGRPDLDASRVMVTGGSYGGHMTFAVSYLYPDRIAASLPVVGMSNLVTFLENTSGYRRDLRRVEYGDERDPQMRAYLERIAPMNNAEKIVKPIFVVQGVNDPRVPYSEATQLVEKIKGTNKNVWFLAAKDEGHGFAKKPNVDYQFYATVLFVRRFLLGEAQGASASSSVARTASGAIAASPSGE